MNVFCCFPLVFDTEAQIYEIIFKEDMQNELYQPDNYRKSKY